MVLHSRLSRWSVFQYSFKPGDVVRVKQTGEIVTIEKITECHKRPSYDVKNAEHFYENVPESFLEKIK